MPLFPDDGSRAARVQFPYMHTPEQLKDGGKPDEGPKQGDILRSLEIISGIFGLRPSFFSDLFLEQDDWSFIIKIHALLESVVCSMLAAHLSRPALEDTLAAKVEMEARIEMLKALNLVSDQQRKMMRTLSRLRNKLVHNVKQTDFTFSSYLENKETRKNFVEAFTFEAEKPLMAEFILANPRATIWMAVVSVAGLTVQEKLKAQDRSIIEALRGAGLDEWKTKRASEDREPGQG